MNNTLIQTNSDYWLDGLNDIYDVDTSNTFKLDINLIRLASVRRAISNFVNIITNKQIPVYFNSIGSNATDGKSVSLSANILGKEDFDSAVGLALHEGSHILLSDFKLLQILWSRIPPDLYELGKIKKIKKGTMFELVKYIHNYIEDRYVDKYIYTVAPGYRGYYIAMYNKFWDDPAIGIMLESQMYRVESIDSYKMRIVNFTNPKTDLSALNGLRDIARVIDLKHIERLILPQDRFDITYDVVRLILENICDPDSDDEKSKNPNTGESLSDVKDCAFEPSERPINTTNRGVVSDIPDTKQKNIDKAIAKQNDFLTGSIKKKSLSKNARNLLDTIEKSGVSICKVGKDFYDKDNYKPQNYRGIECIVVKNLTKELIETNQFPLKTRDVYLDENKLLVDAVQRGVGMGIVMGRKLQIRNETVTTVYSRKSSGKVDNRLISDLGWNSSNIFYTKKTDRYNDIFLHISVDASGSMLSSFEKWSNTMTTVVAICKAASMLNNVHITVSFRSTIYSDSSNSSTLPYVVIAYDSSKDNFNKILNLFPLIFPSGNTPEGLSFEAIIDYFNKTKMNESRYFLNFSDGEPMMYYNSESTIIEYIGEPAALHTKKQVNNIKNNGYQVLSYFIRNDDRIQPELVKMFKLMYGSDSKFIKITSVFEVIKTLNELFSKK